MSNALDLVKEDKALTVKMVGGVIDVQFFLGDGSAESALIAFHQSIGSYSAPPIWYTCGYI